MRLQKKEGNEKDDGERERGSLWEGETERKKKTEEVKEEKKKEIQSVTIEHFAGPPPMNVIFIFRSY